ncbi:TIGR02678 family protein [Frankia sp. AgPm24]|uniref:TIGR02678 family protein n=1 Tax=Frankia sp. AgPm24 TaxID=631128 RepID=UPI00200CD84A|nr:TIGR02678 family protein [Frankia sp. AgPm24]MCK9925508.1 TIGR02678 family protein [Frankia sp. AgPm24]
MTTQRRAIPRGPRPGASSTAVIDALDAQRAAERRRAMRAILRRPLLVAHGPDADTFRLVRRHQTWLRDWFTRETGWSLRVDPEVARLAKIPADLTDGTRPATAGSAQQPFSRRRYVLLCLALASLERADNQITLGSLADDVMMGCAAPELAEAGIRFSLDSRDERADLVAAVRVLLDLGVLRRVAGDETTFTAGTGDALYDLDRRALSGMLVTRRGPSTVSDIPGSADVDGRLAAVVEELTADTDDARNLARRQALTRRLLDDPVIYYADLDEGERAYLSSQRVALTRRITEATGLVAEVRAEGIAMVDPDGDLTDTRMPEDGTDGHATLLLAEHLAREGARRGPDEPIAVADLDVHMRELIAQHQKHWRKGVTEPDAEVELVDRALSRMRALGLLRRHGDDVFALPALARFALGDLRDGGGQEALA